MLLYNKRAVVCGGSDGIGKSCAQLLAKNGASITIIARNESKIQSDTVTLVVQINGKLKDRIEAASDLTEEEIQDLALASERITELLKNQEPKRIIVMPPALINVSGESSLFNKSVGE